MSGHDFMIKQQLSKLKKSWGMCYKTDYELMLNLKPEENHSSLKTEGALLLCSPSSQSTEITTISAKVHELTVLESHTHSV